MSVFKDQITRIVQSVPSGSVLSYGQVAAYTGLPRAARQVGLVLREMEEDVPWWRVVNNSGRVSITGNWRADKLLQSKLLCSEGVEVGSDFTFVIEKYRFRPTDEQLKEFQLESDYREKVMLKYQL